MDNDPTNPNTPNQVINLNNVGLCAHRFDSDTGEWDFSENYSFEIEKVKYQFVWLKKKGTLNKYPNKEQKALRRNNKKSKNLKIYYIRTRSRRKRIFSDNIQVLPSIPESMVD